MKILMINKYHHITGGGDTYYFQLSRLLRSNSHEVIEFCLDHPKNFGSKYSKYFVKGLTHENWRTGDLGQRIKAYLNGIYNLEAKQKIKLLIKNTEPDVAHIHNIFYQISPSILVPLKKAGIPIVQTLHDYQIICASNNLYSNNHICEACKGGSYYNILRNHCYNNSFVASFLAFSAKVIHSAFKMYSKNVNLFISASQFLRDKLVCNGIDESKIVVFPYAIDLSDYEPTHDFKEYVVFAGRLVRHKGIMALLRVFESLPIKLIILGSGELQPEIKDYIRIHNLKNIEIAGFLEGEKYRKVIKNAKFVVVPSEWYENSPMIIYESFAMGKPVIASNIGGIPELATEDVGLLFDPGNVEDLQEKIAMLYNNDDLVRILGMNARRKVEKFYNRETHYKEIIRIYERLINEKS